MITSLSPKSEIWVNIAYVSLVMERGGHSNLDECLWSFFMDVIDLASKEWILQDLKYKFQLPR